MGRVSVLRRPVHQMMRRWRWLLLVVIIGVDAFHAFLEKSDNVLIIICLWLISLICFIRLILAFDPQQGRWRNDTGGIAAVIALASLTGYPAIGLGLCIGLLTGELVWRMRKLSRV